MSRHDEVVRLRHMLDHAREAIALIRVKDRQDLDDDRVLSLALVRLLEIVGEAAGRVSEDTRTRHSTVPWSQVIGLRNRLIHGYDSIDLDILWAILTGDLPGLVSELTRIIGDDASV